MDALLCLMAVYYVFHRNYCPEIETAFLFIQKEILGRVDQDMAKNGQLQVFLNLYESSKNRVDDSDVDDD